MVSDPLISITWRSSSRCRRTRQKAPSLL